jgi:hypothetical protein
MINISQICQEETSASERGKGDEYVLKWHIRQRYDW